jgi:uncharacterized membrane protein YkoI
MNRTLPALLLIALGATAQGQTPGPINVPAPVKAAFAKRFPKAEGPKWEMENKKDYEADFKQDGTMWSACFAPDGSWLETEHAIKADALPEEVRKTIAAKYADHHVKEAEQAETPKGTVYEVEFAKGKHEMEVVFSADGTVVKTKEENDDGEKDEKDEKD